MSNLNPKLYTDARRLVRSGDVALYRAKQSLLNRLIARAGGTPYCHAGMIAKPYHILALLEMVQWHNGREVTLESQVRGWPGQWDIYRPISTKRQPYNARKAVNAMHKFIDTPYGWGNLFITALRHTRFISKLLPPLTDDALNGSAPFCSQAVSRACRAGGVDPRPGHADIATEPGHLANPKFAKYLFTLEWNELPEVVECRQSVVPSWV